MASGTRPAGIARGAPTPDLAVEAHQAVSVRSLDVTPDVYGTSVARAMRSVPNAVRMAR
jgi:hypothetical protein